MSFPLRSDTFEWLRVLNYDLPGLAPQLTWPTTQSPALPLATQQQTQPPATLWQGYTLSPHTSPRVGGSPFADFVPRGGQCVSGVVESLREGTDTSLRLGVVKPSTLREDFWPSQHEVSYFIVHTPIL